MTNLQKMSMQRLLRINRGISKLFYFTMSGIENGGPDISREDATELADVLDIQTDIQKILYKKLENVIEPFEFQNDDFSDEDTE